MMGWSIQRDLLRLVEELEFIRIGWRIRKTLHLTLGEDFGIEVMMDVNFRHNEDLGSCQIL